RRVLREGAALGRREREPRRVGQHEPPLRGRVPRRRRAAPPGPAALPPGPAGPGDAVRETPLAPRRQGARARGRGRAPEGLDRKGLDRGARAGRRRGSGEVEEAGQGAPEEGTRGEGDPGERQEDQRQEGQGGGEEGLTAGTHGTEDPPDRLPPRDDRALALA